MANIFISNSLTHDPELVQGLRKLAAGNSTVSSAALGGRLSAKMKAEGGASDCDLALSISDIECFGREGLDDLIENRSPEALTFQAGDTIAGQAGAASLDQSQIFANLQNQLREINKRYTSFVLAKINYKSPCEINGISMQLDMDYQLESLFAPLMMFGKLKDDAGVLTTGAAHRNLIFMNSAFGGQSSPVSSQRLVFAPAEAGAAMNSSENEALMCWVLLGVAAPKAGSGNFTTSSNSDALGGMVLVNFDNDTSAQQQQVPCPERIIVVNLVATKPEWNIVNWGGLDSALEAIANRSEDLDSSSLNSWGAREWSVFAAMVSMKITQVGMASMQSYQSWKASPMGRQLLPTLDINSDSEVDIIDIVAGWNWVLELGSGSGDNLPTSSDVRVKYPKYCCDDDDEVTKETPEEERDNPGCAAEIEILNILCRPESMNKKKQTEKGKVVFTVARTGDDSLRGLGLFVADVTKEAPEDCDEDDDDKLDSDEESLNSMFILVGMRNKASIAGFQFDVGFNKYSSAPLANIVATAPSNSYVRNTNWTIVSKAYDDRFGYDRVVRVIGWQPLTELRSQQDNKGVNIQDERVLDHFMTQYSIPPSGIDFENLAVVEVRNAPPTTCPCPKKRVHILGKLAKIPERDRTAHQISNPELYEQGKEWHGPTVFYDGMFWTAETPDVWTKASLPLHARWDGVDLFNKRAVTNEFVHEPAHSKYDLTYYGEFAGLLATVPSQYENLSDFYRSPDGIGPWVQKALANGLDVAHPSPQFSKYGFLANDLFERVVQSLSASRISNGGTALNRTEIGALYTSFKANIGFASDANLDGKFDIADLLALYNSAQIRMLMPDPFLFGMAGSNADTWRSPPSSFISLLTGSGGKQGAPPAQNDWSHTVAVFDNPSPPEPSNKTNIININRIVPTYCLDTMNTETRPDHCPAIIGGEYAETVETLNRPFIFGDCQVKNKFGFQYLSHRMDILPNKQAEALFMFKINPSDGLGFLLRDTSGNKVAFKFKTGATNGAQLDGDFVAIQLQGGSNPLTTTMNNAIAVINASTLDVTASGLSTNNGFKVVQNQVGSVGNTPISYFGNETNLLKSQDRFAGGSSFLSNLSEQYRTWSEYFKWRHGVEQKDLYQNEEAYSTVGASYFEIKNTLNLEDHLIKKTRLFGFVARADATLNFCGAYDASTSVKVKVLPGSGFNMCDVYDAETGAKLTKISADTHNGFYTVPSHGKINIISHNALMSEGYYNNKNPNLKQTKHFTPITHDGGALEVAKVWVTPMPDYSSGKYIELLCGENNILGGDNLCMYFGMKGRPLGSFGKLLDSEVMATGPKSSQFSQWYYDDSSSLHTYADYMLHAELIGPQHVRIKYNTMKPFKYASFTVKTHNGAEIENIKLLDSGVDAERMTGWAADYKFHETQPDVYGFPLEPTQYSSDGYNVVNVYITGSYTDEAGVVHSGVSYPEAFNGYGNLCDIYFNKPLFDKFPLKEKKYICPPIGKPRLAPTPRKPKSSYVDETLTGIEKSYPEGSKEKTKRFVDDGKHHIVVNFDGEESENSGVVTKTESSGDVVEKWISQPGNFAVAHNGTAGHKPKFHLDANDLRRSVKFEGGMGLTTPTTGVNSRSHDIHKWTAYAFINATDTINGGMNSGEEAVLFTAGGNGSSQMKLTLKIHKTSTTDEYKLMAVSQGNNTGGSAQTKTIEYTFAKSGGTSKLHDWHIISWTGNSETNKAELWLDGESIGSVALDHSTALGTHAVATTLGHDGSATSISSTLGSTQGKPFKGKIGHLTLWAEEHDSDTREKWETYLAMNNKDQGQTSVGTLFPEQHFGSEKEAVSGVSVKGLSKGEFLRANPTDARNIRILQLEDERQLSVQSQELDLGSDRCSAQWTSDIVCLDKSAQTLLNISCQGTGEGFFLG